jgi:hypothetical protein
LYFFGSASQTPQRGSDIVMASLRKTVRYDKKYLKATLRISTRREVMSKTTFGCLIEKTQPSEVPCPKTANSRGELRCPHHSTKTSSTNHHTPTTMSFRPPLRQQSLRAFESWTCASCSRSLTRLPRARNATVKPARRWLTTTKETRQGHVPRMDQMHARYKEKNRTVM